MLLKKDFKESGDLNEINDWLNKSKATIINVETVNLPVSNGKYLSDLVEHIRIWYYIKLI